MAIRDFQSRLAMKHSIIQRKIIDNQVELAANPTDCIRVRCTRNDEGDKKSSEIIKATVDPIIWPALKDIPIRKLSDDGSGHYQITSMVNHASDDALQNFILYFPHKSDLMVDDIIVRVFLDPDVEEPIIIVVKVSELTGTFSQLMLLWEKATCTLEMEALPPNIVNIIGEMAKRRLHIQF